MEIPPGALLLEVVDVLFSFPVDVLTCCSCLLLDLEFDQICLGITALILLFLSVSDLLVCMNLSLPKIRILDPNCEYENLCEFV